MVKMDLGSSNAQSSSTATVTSNHIAAYQGLIASLQGFSGTADLKGAAYDSAKTYASSVLVPLLQGAILLSEKIASSTAKLPSEYSNQVAPESLDSADLERQIATYTAAYNRANEWLTQEMKRDVVDDRNVLQAQKAMARHLAKKHELEEKLRKLLAFNNTSASLFSEVDGLFQAVSQGMSQVKAGFSSFDGTFKVPAKSDMSWATTITSSWKKREKVIQALQHSGNLTKQDVEAVQAYITGGSFEGEETILIYDNYYGYAKYVISMSAIGEGDMSLKFNSSGLEGLEVGDASLSRDGKFSNSINPIGTSALDSIYNYDMYKDGISDISTTFLTSNSGISIQFGMKYINNTLAMYSKSKSEVKSKITPLDMTGKVIVEYEEGKYLRNKNNEPHKAPVDNLVDEIGDWMGEHPNVTKTVTVIGGITGGAALAYFAWPVFAGSAAYTGIVELGGAVGGALAGLWNIVTNAFA